MIGIIYIVLEVFGKGRFYGFAYMGHGIWCGIFFLVAGGLGICASQRKTGNKCLIISFMIMCIFASIFAGIMLIMSSIFLGVLANNLGYRCRIYTDYHDYHDYTYNPDCGRQGTATLTLLSLLLIISVAEIVVSIWSSAICCNLVCCCKTYGTRPVVVYYAVGAPPIGGETVFMGAPAIPPASIVYQIPAGQPVPSAPAFQTTVYPQLQHSQAYGQTQSNISPGQQVAPPYSPAYMYTQPT